jgi:hypothetical protein
VPVKRFDKLAHQAALVHSQPIPDDQQLAFDLRLERLEKLDNLRSLDRTGSGLRVRLGYLHNRYAALCSPDTYPSQAFMRAACRSDI